jgi:hypothetical protein
MLQFRASRRWAPGWAGILGFGMLLGAAMTAQAEPDPKSYWDVNQIKPGMKGIGHTVMSGIELEKFEAEVLGVMRNVSPGRDMVLCRLRGCKLDHYGIIQGMSGSPVYIEGKLLGAVAYAWEFAKEPIAGVTPFSQMVQYARANERRLAAESGQGQLKDQAVNASASLGLEGLRTGAAPLFAPVPASGGSLGEMRPIATPLAASGFGPRALAFLRERLGPLGMTAMAGGSATEEILERAGDKPLAPGSPLSIALVTGDFDLSGIGTVTHVEGDRVYGFGHPLMSFGACDLPMMTGYIHTVYPRASVSMKMGSPLKVVGVIDTDVSTGVAGRLGKQPDLLPLSVQVKAGAYAEPHRYHVQIVREPLLLPTLVMAVLTNAIDTEGNLPDELTARIQATIRLKGHDPIVLNDTLSGPRYAGPNGPVNLFATVAGLCGLLVRNPMEPVRIERIECYVELAAGRKVAEIASIRLATDRLEPGQTLKASVTFKPFKGDHQTLEIALPLPADLPEGTYEAAFCDLSNSLRRRFRNDPALLEPRDLESILKVVRFQAEPKRTALYLHVPLHDRGLSVEGQRLPNLPGSVRAIFSSSRQTADPQIKADLIATLETPWVVEGSESIKFTVVKDRELSAAY